MKHNNANKIIDIQNVFKSKDVLLTDMAQDVITYQGKYTSGLNIDMVMNELYKLIANPEVYDTIMTAALIDNVANNPAITDMLPEHFSNLISKLNSDYFQYGVDEQLGISIAKQYGSISEASFGDLDNTKFGVAKKLDEQGHNTMLDDIASGIISAVSGKIARKYGENVLATKSMEQTFALIVNNEIVETFTDTVYLSALNRNDYNNLGIIRKL